MTDEEYVYTAIAVYWFMIALIFLILVAFKRKLQKTEQRLMDQINFLRAHVFVPQALSPPIEIRVPVDDPGLV
jgi:ABC-type Co2+ transport system permease subunit